MKKKVRTMKQMEGKQQRMRRDVGKRERKTRREAIVEEKDE